MKLRALAALLAVTSAICVPAFADDPPSRKLADAIAAHSAPALPLTSSDSLLMERDPGSGPELYKVAPTAFAPAHIATKAALAATASTDYPNGVWRDDYSAGFGAPPLFYKPSNSACSLNAGAGDGGSQVQSADGKCWLAVFPAGPLDARWWGASYPFHIYVSQTGSDANNYGLDVAHPLATTQKAVQIAHKLDFRQQSNFVVLEGTVGSPSSLPGFLCDGEFPGAASDVNTTTLNIQSRNGSAAVSITDSGYSGNIIAEPGCRLVVQGLTISVGPDKYGMFAERGGYISRGPDIVYSSTGPGAAQAAEYTEANGYIQAYLNNKITVEGSFKTPFLANGGRIRWDPEGTSGEFSSGPGLTVSGAFISAASGGEVLWWVPVVSGSGVTGDLVSANSNSTISAPATNGATNNAQIPGSGITRLWGNARLISNNGAELYRPSVGACTNGGVVNSGSNYAFQVQFSGANSTCTVNFGKPSAPATAFFASAPSCSASRIGGGATDLVKLTSVSTAAVSFIPSGANFANGEAVQVICQPQEAG
jgi:hypothetical protein